MKTNPDEFSSFCEETFMAKNAENPDLFSNVTKIKLIEAIVGAILVWLCQCPTNVVHFDEPEGTKTLTLAQLNVFLGWLRATLSSFLSADLPPKSVESVFVFQEASEGEANTTYDAIVVEQWTVIDVSATFLIFHNTYDIFCR